MRGVDLTKEDGWGETLTPRGGTGDTKRLPELVVTSVVDFS